ncbi:MAG: hypothetical protein O6830_03205 [Candidatus Dadabacteria bacterium]|nr:hypothetical protein [Candidatus Dadabacteria bacterium]
MFIEIRSKDGELSWVNLKQVLVIKLGRPTGGWVWGFSYRNETLWSETFESKEEADKWLENALGNCKIPGSPVSG